MAESVTPQPAEAFDRLRQLIGYGCAVEVLANIPLVLEAAEEAEKQ